MKKHMRKREKGAVTVFLTLILVPCMVFTCVFGDASRVALSKSQAAAASDLALYSLMAHYDEELKEWYGLVASCQSIDEFYDVTKQYFVGMMDANGLDDTASNTFIAYLDAARNGDFTDFLQVDGLDSVKVESVSNGGMGGNPALIEDGIVEFMKYRGPVVIVANLWDRLSKLNMDLGQADENEPIVETKKEYAKAEGEMMSDLLYTYLAIEQYMDYREKNHVPDLDQMQNDYAETISLIYTDFEKMTDTITKYYAATEGIKNLSTETGYDSLPKYLLPDTKNLNSEVDAIYEVNSTHTYRIKDIGATENEDRGYEFSSSALTDLLDGADEKIDNVKKAAERIVTACSSITAPTAGGDVNEAVYCMRIQKEISGSDLHIIHNDGSALMQLYAKLILAQQWDVPDISSGKNWADEIKNVMVNVEEIHRNYLSYGSPNSEFENLLSQYKYQADRTVDNVKKLRYEFYSDFCGRNVTVGGFLEEVRDKLGTLKKHLDAQIANIDTVINGGSIKYPTGSGKPYSVVSLDTLKQKIINYSNARDNWGSEANSHSTDYAVKEQDEYKGTSTANDLPAAIYEGGAESVEALKTRLTNIRNDMENLRTLLESCTYGGQKIYELSREPAITAVKSVAPTTVDPTQSAYISLFLSQNTSAAKDYHQQLMPTVSYTPPTRMTGEKGNQPDLTIDIPELYKYMREQFKKDDLEKAVKAKDEQEKKNKENQEKADQEAKKSKGFEDGFLDDLGKFGPKETSGSGSFGGGTMINGLIDAVGKITGGNIDEFRDQIYVCVYIMEMFSYSSYNNEGQYNLSDELLTLDDYDQSHKGFKSEKLRNGWKEEDPKVFTDNKSLTNRMINSQNNRSNLAEVEYILYGKATNKENLETAYGHIFAIREALNIVSGFVNFYSGSNATAQAINASALLVAELTMGVIPPPVTKAVLIGILATMETAHDMKRLKAGIPVAVYKATEKDWYCSISGDDLDSLFSGEGLEEPKDENGIFYSDYLLLFLLIASNDCSMYSDMLLRIGDLIEGNVAMQTKNDGFDLEQAQCYFKMTGNLSVKPLLVKIPLVANYSGADASSLFEVSDWCSYSLNIVRGYS